MKLFRVEVIRLYRQSFIIEATCGVDAKERISQGLGRSIHPPIMSMFEPESVRVWPCDEGGEKRK